MKNQILIYLVCFFMISCSNDDEVVVNDANEIVISASLYANAPSDPLTINSLEIVDDFLTINFSASGCSGDTWQIKLIDSGNTDISFPPQRMLRLSLKNEEDCEAYITKELSFDISNLQIGSSGIFLLVLVNSNDGIWYVY